MYLFDTDTITNVFKRRPSPELAARLRSTKPSGQFVSAITVAEIVYGAERSGDRDRHLHNLQTRLLPNVTVLDFDLETACIAGRVRAELAAAGKSIAFADLQIAAAALANELILVTGNVRRFRSIPRLRVENWLT